VKDLRLLDAYRDRRAAQRIYGWEGDSSCGCFRVPSPIDGQELVIVASSDAAWEHVSVSRGNRCPNWPEMEFVKRKFFKDDETAMQLHVPVSDHISAHPHCLHIWRPLQQPIPRPPGWMVAPSPSPPS
jgi:hypothetical protein